MKYQLKINEKLTITDTVAGEKELVKVVAFFDSLPKKCPLCDSPVRFFHRSPQDYDFYGLECTGTPQHETNFGQKKADGSFFFKGQWQKAYAEKKDKPPVPEEPF